MLRNKSTTYQSHHEQNIAVHRSITQICAELYIIKDFTKKNIRQLTNSDFVV